MKTKQISLILLLCSGIFAGMLFTGATCSPSPNRAAYQTVASTRLSLQEGLVLWNTYVGNYHPGTNAELKVKAAYEKAQASLALVIDAGKVLSAASQTNAAGTTGFTLAIEQAVGQAASTKQDFFNLLSTFGISSP